MTTLYHLIFNNNLYFPTFIFNAYFLRLEFENIPKLLIFSSQKLHKLDFIENINHVMIFFFHFHDLLISYKNLATSER
jgi:hypothetical protein